MHVELMVVESIFLVDADVGSSHQSRRRVGGWQAVEG